ncbi:hypothetical protein [Burkholderia multivorans]|uniref:hypothetical protein n=1 Tax=Burkholderia multivorans TaxID=87883 RepID=UPI0021BEB313|nr:hypothetical protein [Burkholderia multivorans]
MTTKSVRIDEVLISKAKERRFQSTNQYLLYLMEFEEAHRRGSYNQVLESHNKVMGFVEMERMELAQLNKGLYLLVKKLDIELQLAERERTFLIDLMSKYEEKGMWSYEKSKGKSES